MKVSITITLLLFSLLCFAQTKDTTITRQDEVRFTGSLLGGFDYENFDKEPTIAFTPRVGGLATRRFSEAFHIQAFGFYQHSGQNNIGNGGFYGSYTLPFKLQNLKSITFLLGRVGTPAAANFRYFPLDRFGPLELTSQSFNPGFGNGLRTIIKGDYWKMDMSAMMVQDTIGGSRQELEIDAVGTITLGKTSLTIGGFDRESHRGTSAKLKFSDFTLGITSSSRRFTSELGNNYSVEQFGANFFWHFEEEFWLVVEYSEQRFSGALPPNNLQAFEIGLGTEYFLNKKSDPHTASPYLQIGYKACKNQPNQVRLIAQFYFSRTWKRNSP